MLSISDSDFLRLTGFLKAQYGINLSKKRTLIEGRLSNLILTKGYHSFTEYLDAVFRDKTGSELTVLLNRLTTNHTFFMRETSHFDYLRDKIFPQIEHSAADRDLRIWSAGCSSGEEPYTLEMLAQDYFRPADHGLSTWNTQILATDISARALSIALEGVYPAEAVESVPAHWKTSYFENIGSARYRVAERIRRDVVYRTFNLMDSFPFRRKFHVIFCRNVMIYFDQPTKDALVNKFYEFTEPGGYLFIGHSESVNREATKYRYVMPAVYRRE